MNKQDALEKMAIGQEFYSTYRSPGFQRILIPRLQALLAKADKDCHDFRLREDRGKYAIVRYNTIKEVLGVFDDIIKDFELATDFCNKHNINP